MHGIKKLNRASDNNVLDISCQRVLLSGRAGSFLEMDSGHKNKKIGFRLKSLQPIVRILCVCACTKELLVRSARTSSAPSFHLA